MTLGVDSTHPMATDALRAAGVDVVLRYIGPFRKAANHLEVARLLADGFGFVPVWEVGTSDALQGYAHGVDHGRRARDAVRKLGLAGDAKVVATVDTSADPAATIAYGRGFLAGYGGPVVVYGSAGVLDAWHAAGIIGDRHGWQTNARGWDRPRRYSAHASIRQHLSTDHPDLGNVDLNDVDPDCPYIIRQHQELTVADVQTILDKLEALEQDHAALTAKVARIAVQVQALHDDYAVSREPDPNKAGDNGTKRYQIGRTYLLVRQLVGRG